jgi:hypothetical protein
MTTRAAAQPSPSSRASVALLLIATVLGVARTQPRLAATVHSVKQRQDVYVLPPPGDLRVAVLGYRAAATDLLWAKLMVDYGVHWSEHRPFDDLNRYLDALVELEPDYRPLYEFVDTLLLYRPLHGTEEDVRAARRYFERGIVERPWDPEVWLHYGQFMAFLAPSFLTSKEEGAKWRLDGAMAITRAVDLGADPDRSLAVASMLKRSGEREAAIQSLERAYALTDDEQTREQFAAQLRALQVSGELEAAEATVHAVESRWRQSFPFSPRSEFLLVGPLPDPLGCAGRDASGKPACSHDWTSALSEIR